MTKVALLLLYLAFLQWLINKMQFGLVCVPGVFSLNFVQFINFHTNTEKSNCKCSIGIGTGLVFAGVVGTSGNRREYSVIGDTVNLAARMM